MRTRIYSAMIGLLALAACSTGVAPMEAGTFMVATRSAQVGFGPANGAKADVYREANEFCTKQNKTVKTISLQMIDSALAQPASASLQFRCE